jgi:type I restriction enzyme S subunit
MKRYEKYKDSGIEWLGEIPEHWEVKKLKYLAEINSKALSESTAKSFVLRYIDISNVGYGVLKEEPKEMILANAPSRARRIVKSGDTLISTVRTYLKAILLIKNAEDNLIASTGFAVISPKNTFIPSYLFYILSSEIIIQKITANSVGVSYPAINAGDIGNFKVWLPHKPEQTAIASYLDHKTAEIDDLITKKEQLLRLYEEEKTALINQAVTKGLNPHVPMKDSGIDWLGEIPAHWEVKKLKYLVKNKLKYGANESALFENIEDPRYIRITDFGNDGRLRDNTFKSLPYETAKDYMLDQGDILFARSGATVGKTFQFKDYKGKACFAGYLIKASPKKDILKSDFIYLYTKSSLYERWKESIFNQATIQNIGADKYAFLDIPIPKLAEQIAIVQYIEKEIASIDAKVTKTKKLIELLKEYKTALISEVVTGKVKVI